MAKDSVGRNIEVGDQVLVKFKGVDRPCKVIEKFRKYIVIQWETKKGTTRAVRIPCQEATLANTLPLALSPDQGLLEPHRMLRKLVVGDRARVYWRQKEYDQLIGTVIHFPNSQEVSLLIPNFTRDGNAINPVVPLDYVKRIRRKGEKKSGKKSKRSKSGRR